MSKSTKAIVWIGVGVIVIMCLFPPWFYVSVPTDTSTSAEYHFILCPPKTRFDTEVVRIGTGLLLVQCCGVVLLGAGLIFVLAGIMAGPRDYNEQ
jgi:hypothetical protein